nr:putative ribonuclease H-like domain-containing protein [Tanacetum cinerariifolium]
MLKGFDKEDLVALWRLVKEKFSTTVPNVDKEKALWVELKRLFEPDAEDVLWKLQSVAEKNDVAKSSKDYYSLWEVIINGDSPIPTVVVEGAVQPTDILTTEQKLARRNELKARGNPTQNIAFVSSSNTNSTTDSVSAATSVSAVCAQLPVSAHPNIDSLSNAVIFSFFANQSTSPQIDNKDLKQIDVDDLEEIDLRWQMAMLTMRARRLLQKTGRNLGDNRSITMGFDMSKVECYNCHRKGHFARECRSPKDNKRTVAEEPQRIHVPVETSTSNALVSQCDGIRSYDWSYLAEEEPANFALMAIPLSSSSFDNEPSLAKPAQDISHATRPMAPIIEDWVSDSEDESEPNDPQSAPSFVHTSENAKLSGHSVLSIKASILETTPNSTSSKTNGSRQKNRKTCFMCMGVDHLIKDCNFHAKPKTQPTPRNSAHRGYDKQYASSTKKYPQKHIVPAAVITKSKLVAVTAARPVSAAVPKIMAAKPRHARSLHTKTNSNIRRHKTHSKFLNTYNLSPKVTAAHAKIVSVAKGKKGNGLHMDFFGPTFVKSLSKKGYCLVITDDYSRFTWVFFLTTKDETSSILKTFVTGLENQLSLKVKVIRSDNGTEFKNYDLNQFCEIKGIKREFSVPMTPQQNGIAERKNRTLIKAVRTMLVDSLLPIPFWAEVVYTACYVQNRVLVTKPQNKTPYELLHGRPPSIRFMRPFGCPVSILNTFDSLGKFEGKNKEGDATFAGNEHSAEHPESTVNLSPSSSALSGEQDDITKKRDKGKSHVDYFTGNRDFNEDFEDYSKDSSNDVSAAGPIVPTTGQNYSNSANPISAAGPSHSNTSPIHGNSSFQDASQSHDML